MDNFSKIRISSDNSVTYSAECSILIEFFKNFLNWSYKYIHSISAFR